MTGKPNSADLDKVWLSSRVTVKRYRAMEAAENRKGIAVFLCERFRERYIAPLAFTPDHAENGFIRMAAACLLIEGLVATQEGWCSTDGLSERAFHLFFGREDRFKALRGYERDFWKGVRCGILHQGETSCGWRLNFTNANAPLFEALSKRINCFKFSSELEGVLEDYRVKLENTPWKYEQWRNVRRKMAATIKDCEA